MSARRRFAQHFLEPAWAAKLVAVIDPRPYDEMIEIGPGRGAITLPLAGVVARLLAIEIDRDLAAALQARVPRSVTVVAADVLGIDLRDEVAAWLGRPPGPDRPVRVAGNLPYNISSPILFSLLDFAASTRGVADATLMLQKEVADRIAARPGTRAFGVLTVFTALGADVTTLLTLPPGAFRPRPRVTSTVVRLRFRPPPVAIADAPLFAAMIRSMFTQRRKILLNALRPFATARGLDPGAVLRMAGVDPARRPETLQIVEMARLADGFAAAGTPPTVL